jgi:hypothetical protein
MPSPSTEQMYAATRVVETNIADIAKGRAKKIADVIGRVPDLVPFSVAGGFNLEMLFNRLITSLEGVHMPLTGCAM